MGINSVLAPYPTFFDAAGLALENGFIYIGQPGFEARSTPKASFFDVALTIPTGTASGAAIRTKGGFPVNGSNAPSMFYADGDYSISICDRSGVLLYSALSMTLALNVGGATGPVLAPDGSLGAVGIGFIDETNTGFVRSATETMQTVVGGVLVAQQTPTGTVFQQPVSGSGFSSGVLALAQTKDDDLTALAALGGTGLAVRTAANTWAQRQIVSADGSVVITNPAGVAGDINLSAQADLIHVLASAHAGANVNTAQDLFPLDITLDANSVYQYELVFSQVKSAGATAHRMRYLFDGTVGVTTIHRNFYMSWDVGSSTAASSLSWAGFYGTTAEREFTNDMTNAGISTWMQERGVIITSTAGTFIPQYRLTAAPGGAYSTRAGSYFRLRKVGAAGGDIAVGPWA